MKVLTINCIYEKFSTGTIIKDIAYELKDSVDFIFTYEIGPKSINGRYRIAGKYEFYLNYVLARLMGLKYGTGVFTTNKLCRYIACNKPDVVHIHCPNTNSVNLYKLIDFLKVNQIPTVITNHAEFFYTGNCAYAEECLGFTTGCGSCKKVFDASHPYLFDRTAFEWKKMKRSFEGFDKLILIAVSPWQKERIMLSPIMKNKKVKVVCNGVDTNTFHVAEHVPTVVTELRRNGIKKVFLHVTGSFEPNHNDLKGGRFIVEIAKKLEDAVIIVVGNSSIPNEEIKFDNIIFLGEIKDPHVLAEFYSAVDTTIIASKRETFGMVCAESLCCGTPIVGFVSGGPESIALEEYSAFVEYGNCNLLLQKAYHMANIKENRCHEISKKAIEKYSKKRMAEEYYKIYNEVSISE